MLLAGPFINSQADVARELGVTRARVCQIMGLLKLPEEIQRFLLELNDQRPLLAITDPVRQV